MKFYEYHFEEYLLENEKYNLHPKMDKIINGTQTQPKSVKNLKNTIIYGPPGVGKYTQFLKYIKPYSPSGLKYEKKISIIYNKKSYFIKISDIHYEIDMSLLGCNSKIIWHELYEYITEIISTKPHKSGIIVFKNFNEINNELLDNIYSYMQKNLFLSSEIRFIIITEHISFIPESILNCCFQMNVVRPSRSKYNGLLKLKGKSLPKNFEIDSITNIKDLYLSNIDNEYINYKNICDKIITSMKNIRTLNFVKFRDLLYDILIYNLVITDCIWYILSSIFKNNTGLDTKDLLHNTIIFLKYYNNNYRPIYHLEKYFLYISLKIS